jgi:hypothetical protein
MRDINRICPYCGKYMVMDIYKRSRKSAQIIIYCDNNDCKVKPCTDSGSPSRVYAELLAITGNKE